MSDLLEGVRVALGELYPADVLARVRVRPALGELRGVVNYPRGRVRGEDVRRAIRLAIMHAEGPAALAVCDRHAGPERDALCCGRVPVRDALRGHVCGVK